MPQMAEDGFTFCFTARRCCAASMLLLLSGWAAQDAWAIGLPWAGAGGQQPCSSSNLSAKVGSVVEDQGVFLFSADPHAEGERFASCPRWSSTEAPSRHGAPPGRASEAVPGVRAGTGGRCAAVGRSTRGAAAGCCCPLGC